MATVPTLLGPDGRPVVRAKLTTVEAGPTLTGVRSVITGYPADGLDPSRLAAILRAADQGYPLPYLELAEQIEERDLHYAGVLATRKRAVSQLDITVEAASDAAEDVAKADMIRAWLRRDELSDEIFDMLDAIAKGISITEIIWDTSEGQWVPACLEWRNPRGFTFDKIDGSTPLLRVDGMVDQPLTPFKYVVARIRAKSGLPIRSGIARLGTWAWLFKSMTTRDWAIFTQNYGQPIRLGKYADGATQADRDILYQAVANIAGDCAAIIPASMSIEFVDNKSIAQSADLYEKRANWLDQQVSKAILGQTASTDAIAGGHAVGKEHRQVQEDIERADARALSAILNRDLVKPWIDLEFGPQKAYPKIKIGRAEQADVKMVVDSVVQLVPLGLRVEASQIRDLLGLDEPEEGAEVLTPPASSGPPALPATDATDQSPDGVATNVALNSAGAQAGGAGGATDAVDTAVAQILEDQGWVPLIQPMIKGLADKLASAETLADVRAVLAAHLDTMDVSTLTDTLARAAFAARISGEAGEALSPVAAP